MGTQETEKTLIAVGLAAIATVLFLLSGCTVQKPKPQPIVAVPPPQPITATTVPVMPSPDAGWETVAPTPPQEPIPVKPQRRMETMARQRPQVGPGGKTLFFEPGRKYVLTCPAYGTVTVRFPLGETIQVFSVGNSGEWMIEKASMGLDLPIAFVAIRRVPIAASTELHVTTDAETYQFLLIPQTNGVSKQHASLFTVVNPETEARRAEYQRRHAEAREQERRAYEIRAPHLDAEHVRFYGVSGDPVLWKPVNVVGDQRHTVIQLPASTGADLPMVTVIEAGKEMRVNTRLLPEENGIGPRIVMDQAFTEARLVGAGGVVTIRGN